MRIVAVFLSLLVATAAGAQSVPISLDPSVALPPAPSALLSEVLRPAQSFDCADVSCKRLRSCEEACHKLLVCGQTRRDGDGDGIPCETLCNRRC